MIKATCITVAGMVLVTVLTMLPSRPMVDGRNDIKVREDLKPLETYEKVELASVNKIPVTCEDAIRAVFPADKQKLALAVSKAESGAVANRKGATNTDGSTDWGCFQINDSAHSQWFKTHDWSDPMQNTQFALQLSKDGTRWSPWNAWKDGKHLKYM